LKKPASDDGKGHKDIYRVEGFEIVPVPEEVHGMFFGGDSYVIVYTYDKQGRQGNVVYYWQVRSRPEPMLWNALSAEKFSDKGLPSNFGQIFFPNQQINVMVIQCICSNNIRM
jgi:hypothetical protein